MDKVGYQIAIKTRDLWIRKAAKARVDAEELEQMWTAPFVDLPKEVGDAWQRAKRYAQMARHWNEEAEAIRDADEMAARDFGAE